MKKSIEITMTDLKRLMKEGSNVQIQDTRYPFNQLMEIANKAREYGVNVAIEVSDLTTDQLKSIAQNGGKGITFQL